MKIWRLGQIHENLDWPIFLRNNKLSFDWFDDSIDYSKVTNFKKHKGWTCIKPWVEELKVGDLIFIINKYSYGGVAIVSDTYKYKIFDIQINDYKLPSIPVQFLHKLEIPISHDLHIQAVRPKAFYHVNGIGFNMTSIMDFINKNYPDIYKKVNEYLYDNKEAESNKISKVCWNNHDWKKPSGSDGKDNSDKTYEGKFGFGHEEWIGENFREINGYHYGFLQALNLKSDLHVDKIYNIDLVANDRNGNFYHVGTINNGICISNQEANEVYNIYKKNGWIDEMLLEIKTVGGIHTEFKNDFVKTLFNLKYKSNDIHINTDFKTKMISSNDDNITTYHNKLLDKKSNFLYEKEESDDNDKDKSTEDITRRINTTVTYDAAHSKMQNIIKRLLKKSGLYKIVKTERNRVDIAAKLHNGNWHYYEIKTYGSAQKSIRYALGQIIEYSFWPGKEKAEKLMIVSDNPHDKETIQYMKILREEFKIPVYYQSFQQPDILGKLV